MPGRDRERQPQARASSGDWAVGAPGGCHAVAGLRPLLRAPGPPSAAPLSPLACPGPPWAPGCPQRGPRSRSPWGLPLPLVERPASGGALGPGLAARDPSWWSLPGRTLLPLQAAWPRPRLALPRSCSLSAARSPAQFPVSLIFLAVEISELCTLLRTVSSALIFPFVLPYSVSLPGLMQSRF